jgi:hypothetical protein
LGHQEAVERVTVMRRQRSDAIDMAGSDWQQVNSRSFQLIE